MFLLFSISSLSLCFCFLLKSFFNIIHLLPLSKTFPSFEALRCSILRIFSIASLRYLNTWNLSKTSTAFLRCILTLLWYGAHKSVHNPLTFKHFSFLKNLLVSILLLPRSKPITCPLCKS
jgi:hypothetical protein